MARRIDAGFLGDIQELNAEDIEIVLLHIAYPTFDVRLARDVVDYIWRGHRYYGAMFELEFISDDENEPRGTLRVPNVDRRIGESILSIDDAPLITIWVSKGSDFHRVPHFIIGGGFGAYGEFGFGGCEDHVPFVATEQSLIPYEPIVMKGRSDPIITATGLYLRNIRCTAITLEADIVSIELTSEPFPAVRATKGRLPGLYV